jgi:hypothetical protein
MRVKRLAVVMFAVVVFAAGCQRGEQASLTGAYGSGVISGVVAMADSGSPEGVEVSVAGTGLTRTLAADGQFVFAAVPDDPNLAFSRADGIDATLRLEASTGHFAIELAQTTAKKASGRRRAVGGGGTKVYQFEGLIRSVAADQIVVYTSKKEEVTFVLNATTVIRHGNTLLLPADLLPDMRVHVTAQQVEGNWVSLQVKVQRMPGEDDGDDDGDDDDAAVREYEGIVVSAGAAELVMVDSHRQEVTFVIDASTVIRKGNTPVLPTDIQPGWRVHVKAIAGADGAQKAIRITVQNTRNEAKVSGVVSAVSESGLTVDAGGTSYTVTTDAATAIRRKGTTITLGEVVVGDRVKVEGTATGAASILAKKIEVKGS